MKRLVSLTLYIEEVLTCYACKQMCSIIEVKAMVYSQANVIHTVHSSAFKNLLFPYILGELFGMLKTLFKATTE